MTNIIMNNLFSRHSVITTTHECCFQNYYQRAYNIHYYIRKFISSNSCMNLLTIYDFIRSFFSVFNTALNQNI